MNDSQPQLDYLREYTPDVVGSLTYLGQAAGYYDANGHYTRTQPFFGAFAARRRQPADRLPAVRAATAGCRSCTAAVPGGAVQATPDGSAPWQVPGLHRDLDPVRPMRRIALIAACSCSAVAILVSLGATSSSAAAGGTYQVRAIFDNAAFAVPGEDVRIAGAPVGSISSLDVTAEPQGGGHARDHGSSLHAVPRQRHVRDPPAVADRRALRRLRARQHERAAADQDHQRPGSRFLPAAGYADQFAGRLRHRPEHLPGADPRAVRGDPQRARDRAWRRAART